MKEFIRGHKGLAAWLGVGLSTVKGWYKEGLLEDAVVARRERVIIYAPELVLDCLSRMTHGRKRPSVHAILTGGGR